MSRARDLSNLGNINSLAVDTADNEVGIASTAPRSTLDVRGELQVGTGIQVGSAGVVTATSFSGSGANLTGLATTETVRTDTITVAGVSTFTGVANFSAAVNADATTDSTSVSTGALIVDGGVGIAKNVYIGAGLSVAGTLTYEDVTNVDSVGLITAKSGVNVSGGQLQVGVAYSVGAAGVATALGFVAGTSGLSGTLQTAAQANVTSLGTLTGLTVNGTTSGTTGSFSSNLTVGSGITFGSAGVATISGTGDLHLLDNVEAKFGDAGDFIIKHNGSDVILRNVTGTGNIRLEPKNGELGLISQPDAETSLYYNNSKKIQTTNDGSVTTGIATATGGLDINADNKYLKIGAGNDLQLYHSGTHSFIKNTQTGYLILSSDSLQLGSNTGGEAYFNGALNGAASLYYDNSVKLDTTYEGAKITGFTSTTAGMGVTGGLFEGSFIKAGKLSDNKTLGISTSNVFFFTTQESTTATPNIVWDDTYSLSSKMAVGDVASVTVITTAAAGGYSANWTIDGNAVTEEWVGGSAPSAGGDDGLDIYSLTIIKTGTGTGDSGFKLIGNLTNATN